MPRTVTLVDESDRPLGEADLLDAHTGQGKLHRAFSVYVFRDDRKELLIQRRSKQKMLWPMIWANTCCSHPFTDEPAIDAGKRRLSEELGFSCDLTPHATFVYRAEDPSGRGVEHEHVTILIGDVSDAMVKPDPSEVAEWKWMNIEALTQDMRSCTNAYAPWFHSGLRHILQ